MSKVPGCSDSVLLALWRKVVRAEWGGKCALVSPLGDCEGSIECHHIKRRNIPHLKYSPSNGVCLCQYHHSKAKYRTWRAMIENAVGLVKMEWLDAQERCLFPDYLAWQEMTRAEWRRYQKGYLQKLLGKMT